MMMKCQGHVSDVCWLPDCCSGEVLCSAEVWKFTPAPAVKHTCRQGLDDIHADLRACRCAAGAAVCLRCGLFQNLIGIWLLSHAMCVVRCKRWSVTIRSAVIMGMLH